jgi:Mg-chelatase subunit ChlD
VRTPLVAAALLAAFGAWLALPRESAAGAPRSVCLVDVSASVRRTRPDWGTWVGRRLEDFAARAAERGEEVRVLAFAEGRRELVAATSAEELVRTLAAAPLDPVPRGMGTFASDLAAALVDAAAWLDASAPSHVVVLTDGEFDEPARTAQLLASLAEQGAAIVFDEPPPPTRADVRLARLEAPLFVEAGAPLLVDVELAHVAARARSVRVEVELAEPGATRASATGFAELVLDDATRARVSIELPAPDAGLWVVRARCACEGDAAPENDVLERLCRVGGGLAGAVVARRDDREFAGRLAAAFEQGLAASHWSVVDTAGLDALVRDVDVVCALDVPPFDLPVAALEILLAEGGGLLVVGGTTQHVSRSRGPGVELLPLVAQPPGTGPRDVVLLLDGSGSMQGEPFAAVRSAARDLLLSTPPGDGLQVVVFTDGLQQSPLDVRAGEVLEDRARTAAESWLADLDAPGGNTSILYSLEQWLRDREKRRAVDGERRAVIVMLTDGQENIDAPNVEQRLVSVRAELERLDAALYTVAIGTRIDREFIEKLVPAAERRLEPAPGDLRRAVADAAAAERLIPGPVRVRTSPAGRELGLPPVLEPWNAASRATLQPGAQLLCSGANDEALAALWSVKGGRVAVFAGGVDWIPDLFQRPQRFAGLVRHLARERRAGTAQLVRDDEGLLVVGVPANEPRLVGVLSLFGVSSRTLAFDADPSGWRADRTGLFELERTGAPAFLEIEGLGRWPVPVRAPRELRGGERSLPPTTRGEPPPRERRGHAAAPWVLALAGALAAFAALPIPGVQRRAVKQGRTAFR